MPRYEKGTQGKLIVQDWEVVTGYPDTPLLYILTRQQAAALISLAEFLEWRTRWENLPVDADIDAFASETMFNLMNPITCGMLTECLEPLFDNLRAQIKQDALFEQYGTQYPAGVPLPPEALEAPLAEGSNPTCNLDIVWAQAEQLVDYSNTMITDTLEQVETATNNVELAQVVTSLPILDELGADAIAGYIELLLDGVAENYAAEFDLAYRNGLACEIFCSAKGDCEITIQKVYDILLARVTGHFGSPGETIGTIFNLLTYLVDQDIDGDVVVDTLFFLLWGGAKLINSFIQDVGTTALETIMELAVNDANNDWETLCDECPVDATVPIFDPAPCGDPDVADGENLEFLGGSRWRATSTARVFDSGVAIKDANGAPFQVTNVTFPDGDNVFGQWTVVGSSCTVGSDPPQDTPLLGVLWTWANTSVGARVEFDFLPV